MSESKPWDLWEVILEESDSKWVRWEDYARLKAEVEQARKISGEGMSVTLDLNNQLLAENARLKTEVQHLMVFCNCTLIPNKELQAKVERLTKAGDAMAEDLLKEFGRKEMLKYQPYQDWFAAKEGKPRV
jgi:hypothetical protein